MGNRIRPTILISVGCLVLLTIVWVVTKNSGQEQADERLTSESEQVDPQVGATQDSDAIPVKGDELIIRKGSAKTITRVPGEITESAGAKHEIDTEFQDSVKKKLESALTGNSEDAITTSNLMKECNTGFGEDQIQSYFADFSNMKFTSERMIQFGNGQQVMFDSLESLETFLWQKHDQCRAVKSLLEDDLRERIKLLADNGLVTARYIYSLWPPRQVGILSEDTLEMLEYQHRALEYSWRNIDEREPLGVLAFALSYAAGTPGLFTPSNFHQGQIFLLAAKKCGLTSPWLDAEIKAKLELWRRFPHTVNLDTLEADSNEIKKLFCD